jgi:hypothetical protein
MSRRRPAHDPRERLNEHHADDLLATARAFGHPDATSARAAYVNRDGIDLTIQTPHGPETAHVPFAEPAAARPSGIRLAFRALARAARTALATDADTSTAS